MILLTFSDSKCNLCILFYFEFYVTLFIIPASAAKHNKQMWNRPMRLLVVHCPL